MSPAYTGPSQNVPRIRLVGEHRKVGTGTQVSFQLRRLPVRPRVWSRLGWGADLNEFIARGTWSLPQNKLHINYLELKAVFLGLKDFQNLCVGKMVLVATDNSTVVSYINKEGGMRSGPLCALLWRILTWCTGKQVTLKARHIPGRLNVVADKLSKLGQTIQTEWSLLPEVFQALCNRWPDLK